jgi:hypothetical protein
VTISSDKEVLLIADQIKRYLDSHPNASDTVEGISQYWLAPPKQSYQLKNIHLALESLVKKGVLKISTTKDGKRIYKN